MKLIYDFSDTEADIAAVGGKGASLTRLSQAGFPVPVGFNLSTEAYRRFVAENGLDAAIAAALAGADRDKPVELEGAAARIRAAFHEAPLPADVAAALSAAYGRVCKGGAVAVRSSATAEDLPGLSFAGQQESFLDIRGEAALLDAVRRCWASLWNGRAVAYRMGRGFVEKGMALAVVVQALVDAEVAGILFTAHPVTGRRGLCLIDAAFGLGEAIVGGMVSPDVFVVDKASGKLLERTIADKALRTVRLPGGGTAEQESPVELRLSPALSDAEALELAVLGTRVETLYGAPVDIEWAREGGRFLLLQARPITALPDEEPEPPSNWSPPDPKGRYARGSIVDFIPEPLTPLFASLGMRVYEEGFKSAIGEMLKKPHILDGITYGTLINGYLYVSMKYPLAYFFGVLAAMVEVLRRMRDAKPRLDAETAICETEVARLSSRFPASMRASELLETATALFRATVRYLINFQTGAAAAGSSEMLISRLWEKWARRPGDPPASSLLLGFESAATRADEALADLARVAAADPALASYLRAEGSRRIARDLSEERPPEGIAAEAWAGFRARLAAHVARHCRSVYDLDFSKPIPSEDPEALVLAMKASLDGKAVDPRSRREASAERREKLAIEAMGRLRGLRRKIFGMALRWAQRSAPLREDAIAGFGIAYPALRSALRELGYRLKAASSLAAPNDIFWLEETELAESVAALDEGRAPADFAKAVRSRKALWKSRKRSRPPVMIPMVDRIMGFKTAAFFPGESGEAERGVLRGVGASGGKVLAPARILRGVEDFGSMKAGEVLVAEITTPAWTPLFSMAAAVVTDVGGPLSHGSIVAREYGIPAVLGCGTATRRLKDGDLLAVDGDAGSITWDEAAL